MEDFSRDELRRIVVVGASGSGKSTLARRLSARLEAPHIELDALFWREGWTETPRPEFRDRVEQACAADRWVLDGNYQVSRDLVWPRATAILWLDYAFPLVFARALKRTIGRVASGEEIFGGNRETFRKAFLSRGSILLWVLKSYGPHRRSYQKLAASPPYPHLRFQVFRRPAQTARFLDGVGSRP